MQADLALSDTLVEELLGHDVLVISTPMHNFSVPSGLKAWIDQIVRLGLTFNHTLDNGIAQYEPLVQGKKALIVTSRGGFGFRPGWRAGGDEPCRYVVYARRWVSSASPMSPVVAAEGEESEARTLPRSPPPKRSSACWPWPGSSRWPGCFC